MGLYSSKMAKTNKQINKYKNLYILYVISSHKAILWLPKTLEQKTAFMIHFFLSFLFFFGIFELDSSSPHSFSLYLKELPGYS